MHNDLNCTHIYYMYVHINVYTHLLIWNDRKNVFVHGMFKNIHIK